MLIRRVKWFVPLLFILVTVVPAFAQETYIAPDGQFTVPIPSGWHDSSSADYGLLTSDNGILVYLLAVSADEIQAGIETGIQSVDPSFASDPVARNSIPLPNGTWTQNVYAYPDGSLDAALGQLDNDSVYLLYMKFPSETALQARQNDVNTILMGFTVGQPVSLAGRHPAKLTAAMLEEVDAFIQESLEPYSIIGTSVAIVQDGQIIYSQGFGTLGLDNDTAVDSQTLFMIGSVTKSMTTMLAATLVEDGMLAWDMPATDLLPDFTLSDKAATPNIRVHDLFNMSSGVPRYDIPLSLQAYTPESVQAEIARIPLASRPGQAYHYSNFMVALGGYAAAVASGSSLSEADSAYADLMQTRIFDPIGMTDTTLAIDQATAQANHALPHIYDPYLKQYVAVPIDFERSVSGIAPAGSVWSNADDMARYMITQINQGVTPDGTRIVSAENLLETWAPQIDMGGGTSYAMGWTVGDYRGQRLLQHGGGTAGFTADFAFLPDAGLGVVMLTNHSLEIGFGPALREFVFETAFGLAHTSSEYHLATANSFIPLIQQIIDATNYSNEPVDPQALEDYLGDYERGISLRLDETGQLQFTTIYGDLRVLATDERNVFVGSGIALGTRLTFKRSTEGDIIVTIDSLFSSIMEATAPLTLRHL